MNHLKQDINFLEKPLWVVDETLFQPKVYKRGKVETLTYVWETGDYSYESVLGPPTKFDGIVLLYLLLQCQKQQWDNFLEISLYRITKDCGFHFGKQNRSRIKESLRLWKNVTVHFHNSFRKKERQANKAFLSYEELHFSIIDYWGKQKDKRGLDITLSPVWIKSIKESLYYKRINFDQYKTLSSPIAARLYEILIKSFEGRTRWKIGADKLSEKITMKERYASQIERKIKTAVRQINLKTELNITLSTKKYMRGRCIFTFKKEANKEQQDKPFLIVLPDRALSTLPKACHTNESLIEVIDKALKEHDEDYVIRNIEYANKNSKSNYPKYLKDSLTHDYAEYIKIMSDEAEEKKRLEEDKAINEFQAYDNNTLQTFASAGNIYAKKELERRNLT